MLLQAVSIIAEERIAASMRKGEFENLEGKGRKIVYEDDSMIPEDLRMAYKILKNAGYVPEELRQEKEIMTAAELLAAATDEQERYKQMQKLNYLVMKVNARRRRPVNLEQDADYYRKVVERVSVRISGREAQDR
ncbi:MAG: DUF1992 domain-containing protein [Desulfovibrio sp.]